MGQNNHRYFFMFVVYVWLSSFYGALNVLPLCYEAYYSEVSSRTRARTRSFPASLLTNGEGAYATKTAGVDAPDAP